MKIKNKVEVKKNEFRTYKLTGHPSYIYARVGNDYKFIGITHSEITKDVKNIRLDKNPNPNDMRVAYAHPYSRKDKTRAFSEKRKGWKISKRDKDKVKKYF